MACNQPIVANTLGGGNLAKKPPPISIFAKSFVQQNSQPGTATRCLSNIDWVGNRISVRLPRRRVRTPSGQWPRRDTGAAAQWAAGPHTAPSAACWRRPRTPKTGTGSAVGGEHICANPPEVDFPSPFFFSKAWHPGSKKGWWVGRTLSSAIAGPRVQKISGLILQ